MSFTFSSITNEIYIFHLSNMLRWLNATSMTHRNLNIYFKRFVCTFWSDVRCIPINPERTPCRKWALFWYGIFGFHHLTSDFTSHTRISAMDLFSTFRIRRDEHSMFPINHHHLTFDPTPSGLMKETKIIYFVSARAQHLCRHSACHMHISP